MRKIAPEIENLMWTLAETGNQDAIEQFEARFPDLKIELTKRIMMVRSLKRNRPETGNVPVIPRFNPSTAQGPSPSKAPVAVAIAFAVIAMSALGYTLTTTFARKPIVLAPAPKVNLDPIQLPEPATSNSLNPPTATSPNLNSTQVPAPPAVQPDASQISSSANEPKWAKPQVVKMRDVPLLTVAKLVAAQGGLTLEIAPGMPNPSVRVDYQDINAADILKDLGKTYAFTPMLSDDNSVILIPAVAHTDHVDSIPSAVENRRPNP